MRKFEKKDFPAVVYFLIAGLMLVAIVGGAVGWVLNIVQIVSGFEDDLIRIVRIIGIFLVPVGAIMGWV